MKRLLKISALLLLYCLSTAKSCDGPDDNEATKQARMENTCDSIRSAVTSGTLDEESLRAFEESARVKLFDFCDYRHIMADTSLDPAFREKAVDLIRGLFVSKDARLIYPGLENPEFSSVMVHRALQRTSDSSYSGQLSFVDSSQYKQPKTGSAPDPGVCTIDIYVVKRTSLLGRDTLKTWKVLLGQIHFPGSVR